MPPVVEPRQFEVDVSDLVNGQTRSIEVAGRKILLCNVAGEFFAIQQRCSHAAYSLADGRLAGFEIECPLHGARFDVRDGSVKRRPARTALETYSLAPGDTGATVLLQIE